MQLFTPSSETSKPRRLTKADKAKLSNFYAPLRDANDFLNLCEKLMIPDSVVTECLEYMAQAQRPALTRVEFEEMVISGSITQRIEDRGIRLGTTGARILNFWEEQGFKRLEVGTLADYLGYTRKDSIYHPVRRLGEILVDLSGEVVAMYPEQIGAFGSLCHEDVIRKAFEERKAARTREERAFRRVFGKMR